MPRSTGRLDASLRDRLNCYPLRGLRNFNWGSDVRVYRGGKLAEIQNQFGKTIRKFGGKK